MVLSPGVGGSVKSTIPIIPICVEESPVEIGNVEKHSHEKRFEGFLCKCFRNNRCFCCHLVGCRPWKHQDCGANNFESDEKPIEEVAEADGNAFGDYDVLRKQEKDTPEGLLRRVRAPYL